MTRRFGALGLHLVLLAIVSAMPAQAGTFTVGRLASDCDCPPSNPNCCNFHDTTVGSTAGGGILAAMSSPSVVPGDTVLVWPGTPVGFTGYTQVVNLKSGVTLLAYGYPDSVVTIPFATSAEPVFKMISGSELTRVIGFTFRGNAGLFSLGGAIGGYVTAGEIRDNVFDRCIAGIGAGIYLQSSTVTVENNLFLADSCGAGGGVVAVSGGSPIIRNNTFYKSAAPFGTDGAAFYATGSSFTFENNIVANSRGASGVFCGSGASPSISCNVFHDNAVGPFAGTCPDSTGTSNNIEADPLFCGAAGADSLGLCSNSPALTGPCGPIGYQSPKGNCGFCSVPTAVGAGVENATWGRIKAFYR